MLSLSDVEEQLVQISDRSDNVPALEWDISPRDDIPKVIVKSNDNGTLSVFHGCLVARSSYFSEFKFDDSHILMDFSFKELKLFFELVAKDMNESKFNQENTLSLFRISIQYGFDDIHRRAYQFILLDSKKSYGLTFELLIKYWLITTKYKQDEAKTNLVVSRQLDGIRMTVLNRIISILDGKNKAVTDDPDIQDFYQRLYVLNNGHKWANQKEDCDGYHTYSQDSDYQIRDRVSFKWVRKSRHPLERHFAMFLVQNTTDEDLSEIKNLFILPYPSLSQEKEFIAVIKDRTILCRLLMSLL
jgi:hypothetical protein